MRWFKYSWRALRLSHSKTRRTLRWLRRIVLVLLLPLLLIASFAHWWLLPRLNDYRAEVAALLSSALQLPVTVEQVSATLDGGRLALRLRQVQVYSAVDAPALAHLEQAALVLQVWRSLRERRLVLKRLRIEGAHINVDAQNYRWLQQRPAPATTSFAWPHLDAIDVIGESLRLHLAPGVELTLLHPYLQVREIAQQAHLSFSAALPKPLGERLELRVSRAADGAWHMQGNIQYAQQHSSFNLIPDAQGWQAELSGGRIEQLLAWVQPWLPQQSVALLAALQPQGEITTLRVRQQAGEYTLSASFRALRTQASAGYLGLQNLSGTLQASAVQGELVLDSHQVKIESAGRFRAPLLLDQLRGVINWQRHEQQWRLQSSGVEIANAHGRARAWGTVLLAEDAPPFLDFRVKYQDVKVSEARHYLPVTVIPAAGIAWLDQALVSGKVTHGEMLWRGRVADFPFDRNQGLFETRFQVEDAVLDYQSGWPRLERLSANVQFRNRSLSVTAQRGRLADGVLESASARIDDLAEAVVQVQGTAQGAAQSMWEALKSSPWGAQHHDLPALQASGNSSLQLELTLPTDQRPNQMRGAVTLLENDLHFPTWDVGLQRARGVVRFTQDGLAANQLTASWRGTPVNLELSSAGTRQAPQLHLQAQGVFAVATLLGAAAPPLPISGKSMWKAQLNVPLGEQHRAQSPAFTLSLHSDLRGTALPPPFAKSAPASKAFKLQIQPLAAQRFALDASYADDSSAALVVQQVANTWQLERGELRIGSGTAQLPETPGLSINATLPRWQWQAPAAASCQKPATPALLNMVQRLRLNIGELQLGGQRFTALRIKGARQAQGLHLELDGEQVAGAIHIPQQPSSAQPLRIDLDQLALRRTASAPTVADPCQWPALLLTIARLRVDQRDLGSLRLQAAPEATGVNFANIELQATQHTIAGSATWRWRGTQQVSQISAHLHSPALAQTLSAFGYPAAGISGAETDAQFSLSWPGSPADFALEQVQGDLDLHLGRGQLLDIQPGLGRMVGLFSVESLARRLRLDFSDVLQPGTSFDQITGNVLFANGEAEVEQLHLQAPAAQIALQGQIDMRQQRLDQQVIITPRLGIALPVAGTIAAGPLGAAAGLLAERVLRKNIEKAVSYEYRLHGAWDNPKLEPLHMEATSAWGEPNHNQ